MSKEHAGLPVAGYKPQSAEKLAVVNTNKILEERCLRQIDLMRSQRGDALLVSDVTRCPHDARMIALAQTKIQEGFMWLNRAVMQPDRIKLPEDAE